MTRNHKIYIIIIGILVILNAFVIISVNKRTYVINLNGENPITIYKGNEYKDPGYIAFDSSGRDVSDKVKIESNMDYNHEGFYQIKYAIESKVEITRNVIVKEFIPDNLEVDFKLNGELVYDLERGVNYKEQGFIALGNDNNDYSKYVTIIGRVDEDKVGTYQINYVLNVGKNEKTLTRTINVVGEKYTIILSNNALTNRDVIISIKNNSKYFNYFLTPTNIKVEDEKIDFIVSNNGKYTFYMYDNRKNEEKIEININNIDKELPSGKCRAYAEGKKTKYEVIATDSNGIDKYVHNSDIFNEATFEVMNNSESDVITIYDKAGNSSKIICEYPEIKSKNKIVSSYKSDTLKYWIEKPDKYYVVTHIWVKDAYNQIKTAISKPLGTLESASTILNREIKNKNYAKKGMIALNASAFVASNSNSLVKHDKNWLNFSSGPFIIYDGEIVSNFSNQALPKNIYPVFGLKDNGYLAYYQLKAGAEEIGNNEKIIQEALDSGVKYSFTFNPILVLNNEVKTEMTSKNIRQGLCQIDRNNFVLITNINSTTNRIVGMSFNELATYMVKLNCKTGFNLDGGGSVSLFYKTSSSNINSIKKSSRKIFDILYFVE